MIMIKMFIMMILMIRRIRRGIVKMIFNND